MPVEMDAQVLEVLGQSVPDGAVEPVAAIDMPTAYVDRAHLVAVCQTLRDHPSLQFSFLVEITAADYHPAEPRYEVVYHLACLGEAMGDSGGDAPPQRRLRLKVRVPSEESPWVPSLTPLWLASNWLEREVFDLFGIAFSGHPDLRRILTPDDWVGHPLRKDYPAQVRKDAAAWSPMQLTAEEFAANVRASQVTSAHAARPRVEGRDESPAGRSED